jgi:hypothetical protein
MGLLIWLSFESATLNKEQRYAVAAQQDNSCYAIHKTISFAASASDASEASCPVGRFSALP